VNGEILNAHLHLAARVLDVAEPVVISFYVFGLFDVRDVPDLLAGNWIGAEFQRRLLGDFQRDIKFGTGLFDNLFEVLPVVPPEDDWIVGFSSTKFSPEGILCSVG
jgi:hypothetical protein